MHILVVEDDEDVANFLLGGLREAGHIVDHAGTGQDALTLASEKRFDVVIMDRMLPGGLDGAGILSTMRAGGLTSPALFLSGMGEISDWVNGLQAGGDDYIVKPVCMAALLERLAALRQ